MVNGQGHNRYICDDCYIYKLLEKASKSDKVAQESRQAFLERQHEDTYLGNKRSRTPTSVTTARTVKAPKSVFVFVKIIYCCSKVTFT